MQLLIGIVWIAVEVLIIVSRWRIFTKANQPGWKALIPIYSDYTDFNLAWDGGQYVGLLTVGIIIYIMNKATMSNGKVTLGVVLTILFSLCILIALVVKNLRLARCFGKGASFAVIFLTILMPVGYAILAFGDCAFDPSKIPEPEESKASDSRVNTSAPGAGTFSTGSDAPMDNETSN